MLKIFLSFFMFSMVCLNGATTSSSLAKERKEIMDLKKELNDFYTKKEAEYQKRQLELKTLQAQINKEKREIEELYKRNRDILNDIEGAVASKTSKIYNAMKPKLAGGIFNKMIADGKIEDVFDIILKLKEKKVTAIMKFIDVDNAAVLTQMLETYNVE